MSLFFFFKAKAGIRDKLVTGFQTCALPISSLHRHPQLLGRGDLRVGRPTRPPRSRHASRVIAAPLSGRDASQRWTRYRSHTRSPLSRSTEISRRWREGPRRAVASNNVAVPIAPSATGAITTLSSSIRSRSEEHTSELQSLAYLVCRL